MGDCAVMEWGGIVKNADIVSQYATRPLVVRPQVENTHKIKCYHSNYFVQVDESLYPFKLAFAGDSIISMDDVPITHMSLGLNSIIAQHRHDYHFIVEILSMSASRINYIVHSIDAFDWGKWGEEIIERIEENQNMIDDFETKTNPHQLFCQMSEKKIGLRLRNSLPVASYNAPSKMALRCPKPASPYTLFAKKAYRAGSYKSLDNLIANLYGRPL